MHEEKHARGAIGIDSGPLAPLRSPPRDGLVAARSGRDGEKGTRCEARLIDDVSIEYYGPQKPRLPPQL
jgi:hypothetical protein